MNIGVCIEPFFNGFSYLDKIRKIASIGFRHYEFWFHDSKFENGSVVPEKKDFDAVARLNDELGMETTDFVFNHSEGGIKASLIERDDREKIIGSLDMMMDLAETISCKRLICCSGFNHEGLDRDHAMDAMVGTLSECASKCEKRGITLILEAFNTKVDHPGYFLDDPETTIEVIDRVGSSKVKMLYDIYHMQIMAGDILTFLLQHKDSIGHIHIAGVPGRAEPFNSELNYPYIIQEFINAGYSGAFGLEYFPELPDQESLTKTLLYLSQGK
ncbi:MAG: TIM barrel protein [Spirochaetia bacterium]